MGKNFYFSLIIMINYAIWLIMTMGIVSISYFLMSSAVFAIYSIIAYFVGPTLLAIFLRAEKLEEDGILYHVIHHAYSEFLSKTCFMDKNITIYYFEYGKPIAFAFGNKTLYISSAITQMRQSQQNQICSQAIAESYSGRGCANVFAIVGNLLFVFAMVFLLIGKWLIYVQLMIFKGMMAIMFCIVDMCIGVVKSIFFRRSHNAIISQSIYRLSQLFPVDKISDILYFYLCVTLSVIVLAISFIQLVIIRKFDGDTDKVLSKLWSKQMLAEFINTDFNSLIGQQMPLNTDKLKFLYRIVESHSEPKKRLADIDLYYIIEPEYKIVIHRQRERHSHRIKIRKGTDGGRYED